MDQIPYQVSNFFTAMQAGKIGAAAMMACFAPDAVYEEPFTGEPRKHEGHDAILNAMKLGWEMPMESPRIEITQVATRDGVLLVNWNCHSPSLPGGKGSGLNQFKFRDGLIVELITSLDGEKTSNE